MLFMKESPFSGRIHTMEIAVTEDQYLAWLEGELIQVAMPNISPDEREFILTGITPEEWAKAFGEE